MRKRLRHESLPHGAETCTVGLPVRPGKPRRLGPDESAPGTAAAVRVRAGPGRTGPGPGARPSDPSRYRTGPGPSPSREGVGPQHRTRRNSIQWRRRVQRGKRAKEDEEGTATAWQGT
eukprot:753289-Hanusia_phi.AAC.1